MEMWKDRMSIKFEIKKTRGKEERGYRTLYMKRSLLQQIEAIAAAHNTSFNNVVISMIEACLCDEQNTENVLTPLSRLRRQLPSRGAFLLCTVQSLPWRGGAATGGGEVATPPTWKRPYSY